MSRSKKIVVAEDINAKVLSQVRDVADEFHDKLFAMRDASGIGYEEIMDAAQEVLEGVNIPEEESEEIRRRAKKEGKTFVQMVLELVELGLAASPRHIKTFKKYSTDTGVSLNEVFDECLEEYAKVTIQTHYEEAGQTANA